MIAGARTHKLVVSLASGAALLLAGFAMLAAPRAAAADPSLAVREVTIDARVQPNGDLVVRETRLLQFTGSFSRVFWSLETAGSRGIVVKGVTAPDGPLRRADLGQQPGSYSVAQDAEAVVVTAFGRFTDTQTRLTLSYVAKGAAKKWADTAELYWPFISDQSDVGIDHVRVLVRLPKPVTVRNQVRAWAHDLPTGIIAISKDGVVRLDVIALPPQTFVEARIAFPRAALPAAPAAAAPRLSTILSEEAAWAIEAAALRHHHATRHVLTIVLDCASAALTLALLVWFSVLMRRVGREHEPLFRERYFRDLPADLPPALVGVLWRMGDVKEPDFTATVMDLVRRGVLTLERQEPDGKHDAGHQLTVHRDRVQGLAEHEEELIAFLFDDLMRQDTFTMNELRYEAVGKPPVFGLGWGRWCEKVQDLARERGFLEAQGARAAPVLRRVGLAWSLVCLGSLFFGVLAGIAGAIIGLVVFVLAPRLKRRTPAAADLYARYRALRRYLLDLEHVREKPLGSVALWEQFLVLAVVFGIASRVAKTLPGCVPEVVEDPEFSALWRAFMQESGGATAFDGLHAGLSAALGAAHARSSDSAYAATAGLGGF